MMTSIERRRSTLSVVLLFVSVIAEFLDVCSATTSLERIENAPKITLQGMRYNSEAESGTRHTRSYSKEELIGSDSTTPYGDKDLETAADKRKWEKNTVRVWGKRDNVNKLISNMADDVHDDLAKNNDRDIWENNNVNQENSYGRWRIENSDSDEHKTESSKRKWSNNKVRVWGKRTADEDQPIRTSSLAESADSDLKTVNVLGAHHATAPGRHQDGESRVARSAVWEDDEMIRRNVENMRRAIEKNQLDWVSEDESSEPALLGSPSWDQEHRSTTKRAASIRYGGGSASKAGHYPFYSADGPKRSWRTNVIRVWGK